MNNKIKGMKTFVGAALLAFSAGFSGAAGAVSLLGQAPDPAVIVQAGGYEWVYAGPCAGAEFSCGPVLLHHGFTFATDEQWNASFSSVAELMTAFKYNRSTFTGLCAATYFNTVYDQCDFTDATAGYIWHSPLAPTEEQRINPASETFLVRAMEAPADLPEPASIALIGLGLAGVAGARRKFSK